MTRGRCSSLRLHRDGLAPSTFRRSPGAPVHNIKSGHRPEAEVRGSAGPLEFALDQTHPRSQFAFLLRERNADRGLFIGGNDETVTHYSSYADVDDGRSSIAHKFCSCLGLGLAWWWLGLGRR